MLESRPYVREPIKHRMIEDHDFEDLELYWGYLKKSFEESEY